MSAYGTKRTFWSPHWMSTFDPKRTLRDTQWAETGWQSVCPGKCGEFSDNLSARREPKVGAAQGFGGSDANVFHDSHSLDHGDLQWPHPIRRQVHHIARHRG